MTDAAAMTQVDSLRGQIGEHSLIRRGTKHGPCGSAALDEHFEPVVL
jgi:hypothetical protein